MTVGENSDPLSNPIIFSSSKWATEVKVGAWGQFVAIIRTTGTGPLRLGYVGVFAAYYDCNTIVFTAPLLSASIPPSGTHSYSLDPNLDSACNAIVTAV